MSRWNRPSFKKNDNKREFLQREFIIGLTTAFRRCELNSQHFTEHNGHKNKIDKH